MARRLTGSGSYTAICELANLLVDGPRIHVIDFDDCGTGWLLYDLSTSISLIEHLPEAESFVQAWLRGYQRLVPLSDAHIAMCVTSS